MSCITKDFSCPSKCFKNTLKPIEVRIFSYELFVKQNLCYSENTYVIPNTYLLFQILVILNVCHFKHLSLWTLTLPLPPLSNTCTSMWCHRHTQSKFQITPAIVVVETSASRLLSLTVWIYNKIQSWRQNDQFSICICLGKSLHVSGQQVGHIIQRSGSNSQQGTCRPRVWR